MESIEGDICAAMELYADGSEKAAARAFESLEARLSVACSEAPSDTALLGLLAQVLQLQEEYQQAVLRYEQILKLEPENQDVLFEVVTILLENLESPAPALAILEDRLIPLDPENREYRDMVRTCLRAIKSQSSSRKVKELDPEVEQDLDLDIELDD